MAATGFADLPPEIQLAVFSQLPAKDIQKCRRINRYSRDLLDLKENTTLCVGLVCDRALARIKQFSDRYCDYPMDTIDENGNQDAFLNALVDFVGLHGISDIRSAGSTLFEHRLCLFVDHWLARSSPTSESGVHHPARESACGVAHKILTFSVHQHVTRKERNMANSEIKQAFCAALSMDEVKLIGLSETKHLEALAEEVLAPPGAFAGVPYLPRKEYEKITSMSYGIVPGAARMHQEQLQKETDKRAKVLGLPLMAPSSPFKFFVRTEWARDRVNEALKQDLPPMIKAAVFEEMVLQVKPRPPQLRFY